MQHLATVEITSGCFMQRGMLWCVMGKPSSSIARGPLCSLGRWWVVSECNPKPGNTTLLLSLSLVPCVSQDSQLWAAVQGFSTHKPHQDLQAMPVLFSKSDPKTLNKGHQNSSLLLSMLGTVFHFLTVQGELHLHTPCGGG